MYELSVSSQEQICGGSALTYIIYALLGVAGLKLLRSAKGRLRLGRLIIRMGKIRREGCDSHPYL